MSRRRRNGERLLRLFGDVRDGEGARVVLLAADLFVLLVAYYLLKTIREPLVLVASGGEHGGGAEVKSYAAAFQALLLIGIASGFGWLASRFDRFRLIAIVTGFFVLDLVAFWVAFRLWPAHRLATGIAFFVWVGCFNVMIVAQFWAFANDLYTRRDGERLFGPIAAGSAAGAVVGARLAKPLHAAFGPFPILLIAAALLLVCLALTWLASRGQPAHAGVAAAPDSPSQVGGGFRLMLRDRYLLAVGALTLIKNWVNTTGEYILDRRLLEVARAKLTGVANVEKYIAGFKSDYFTYVNVAVLLLQAFAVSRIVRYLGVRRSLAVLPLVALASYGSMALLPILSVILLGKVAENTLDYSLEKTAEQMLFLVTPRAAKYKAKAVIDTVMVRLGDVLSAALVWVGTHVGLSTIGFVLVNLGLVALWLGLLSRLSLLHRARTGEEAERYSGAPSGVSSESGYTAPPSLT